MGFFCLVFAMSLLSPAGADLLALVCGVLL